MSVFWNQARKNTNKKAFGAHVLKSTKSQKLDSKDACNFLAKAVISSNKPKHKLKTIARTIILINRLAPPKVCRPKIKLKSLAKLIVILRRYNSPTVLAEALIIRFKTLAKLIILLKRFTKMGDFDILWWLHSPTNANVNVLTKTDLESTVKLVIRFKVLIIAATYGYKQQKKLKR